MRILALFCIFGHHWVNRDGDWIRDHVDALRDERALDSPWFYCCHDYKLCLRCGKRVKTHPHWWMFYGDRCAATSPDSTNWTVVERKPSGIFGSKDMGAREL